MLVDISCFHNSSLDTEPNSDLKFTILHKENFWILRCTSLLGVIDYCLVYFKSSWSLDQPFLQVGYYLQSSHRTSI